MEMSDEEDWAYPTLVAFGPNRSLIAVGRSTCSTRRVWEVAVHQAGPVHRAGGVRVRVSTVRPNDLQRPALPGTGPGRRRCCLVCSSWVPGTHKTEQWLALTAERSIENSVYVAGVRQAQPVSLG